MAKDLEVKVKLNTGDFQKGIEQNRAAIKSLDKEKAIILIDLKKEKLQEDFNNIKTNLKDLSSKPATAQILLEKEKALNDLAQIKTQLKGLDKVKIDIEVPKNTALELRAIGESFSAISGVLTQLKDDAVNSFKEFDAARVKLSTIGESGKALGNDLRGLSSELKFQVSAAELATGGYTALSGGFTKTGEAAQVLKAATVGAVGGFSNTDTVTKALVSTLNAYGLSADQASATVDKFSSVQQNGIITIDEYAGQIAQVAPLAAQAGISLDELNGFIATATASGVPVSQTFSGLRQAIASTLKPSAEASKLAAELGIEFDAQALKTQGLSGILGKLGASGNDSAENLVKLFGSVEAVSAIAPSAGKGFEKLQANIAASANSAGTAAKNFDTVSNSVGGRAKALQNELNESLSQFGEKILAVTNPVVAGTTAIVRAFNALPGPVQAAIAVFVGGGAAVAAFGAAVATIGAIAGPTLAGLTLLSGGLATLNTFLTANISLSGLASAGKLALGTASAVAAGQINLAAIATNGLSVAKGIFTATVAPAIAAVAILAAGLAAINFIRYTKDLEELNQALDTNAATAQTSGNETFKLASKLQALGEARKAGKGDDKKELGFLKISKEDISQLENLKKQQEELAAKASDPAQKQTALNIAKDYEIQANALKKQVTELEKIRSAKNLSADATKTDTKALKEQLVEQQKLSKAKADIDRTASTKKQDIVRQDSQKKEEKGIETKRDDALGALKIKQEAEIGKFKDGLENTFNAKKFAGEKAIADFKDSREKAIEGQKRDFEKSLKDDERTFQQSQQDQERGFQKAQQIADEAYQKKKQSNEKAFQDSLSGAKGIIDREAKLGTADPKEAEKLKQQFADEDRIKQQVLSTNVDTKGSKEQFANQAKQIAGVDQIKSQEDAAKVQLALAELEAKAKAQFAEEERAKDKAYEESKKAADIAFKDGQKAADVAFKDQQDLAKLNFETTVLAPQKKLLEEEIQAKKAAFEQEVLKPLKLQQEAELALFKQGKDAEANALKLQFENELDALRTQAKLRDIDLDAIAQKEKLDREAVFKDQQRALDVQSATQVAGILSAAKAQQAGLSAAIGIGDKKIPKFSSGIENFGGGLAYVHAGEVLMNLSSGTSVIPASKVSNTANSSRESKYSISINSNKDPNLLISEALQQLAVSDMRRSGI